MMAGIVLEAKSTRQDFGASPNVSLPPKSQPVVVFAEKPRVLALTSLTHAGAEFLEEFESHFKLDALNAKNRAEAIPAIATAVRDSGPYDAFIILMEQAAYGAFDEEFLAPLAEDCKIILTASAGYNRFDVDWITSQGIWFCNTRKAVAEPTADMAILLTLAVIRDTTNAEKLSRSGLWRGDLVPCDDPHGMVLGIIGLGAIGKYLAKKAAVFGMKIQYYNRTRLLPAVEEEYDLTYCSTMEKLLNSSDVVSVNCPLNVNTAGLISHREFAQMKEGVFFVNTARGPIVDETALIAALESGKVKRAGLDVFETEPEINPYFMDSEKCILQPHLGGLTKRAYRDAERECLDNIRALFGQSRRPVAPVIDISLSK